MNLRPLPRFVAPALALVSWLAVACGSADAPPLMGGSAPLTRGDQVEPTTRCAPGDARECTFGDTYTGGVLHCFRGTQPCSDAGEWLACGPAAGDAIVDDAGAIAEGEATDDDAGPRAHPSDAAAPHHRGH